MSQQFSNAARTELAAGILAGDTTFALDDGQVFPDANNGDNPVGTGTWFKATLQDSDGIEIVYVRTHNSGTTPDEVSHVLRAQEGTTARAFAAGTAIGLRLTAGDVGGLVSALDGKAASSHTHTIAHVTGLQLALDGKQDALVSGTNIKTVGGQSLLGSGNIPTGEPLPTATTISRAGGVITSITETVGGTSRVTTFTRSGGLLTQVVTTYNGKTRTEVFHRTNGVLTGITATET